MGWRRRDAGRLRFAWRRAAVGMAALVTVAAFRADAVGAAEPRFRVRLALPASLEPERAAYEADVTAATERVEAFFRSAGLDVPPGGLIDSATVFETTDAARAYLASEAGIPVESVPATFSGTVEGRLMFLVSRSAYHRTWDALYREWRWTEAEYRRLIVHELAHRAHEAVVTARFGTADAMGPAWFFEGLAVACAEQFEAPRPPMTLDEVAAAVGGGRTPPVSYPAYGRIVRSLARSVGWRALIEGAGNPGFPDALLAPRSLATPAASP